MSYFRRLEGYTPPERTTVHWVSARIEEAATPSGAVDDITGQITLSPAITNPADPPTYDFETTQALLNTGWYRIVWRDTNNDEQPTEWLELRTLSPYAPSVGDIATILRARPVEPGGVRVDVFTDQTNPSAQDVAQSIALYTPLVFARLGRLDNLGCVNSGDLTAAARALAAQRVANEVEESFWPEEVIERVDTTARQARWEADLAALVTAVEACRSSGDDNDGGDSDSRSDPAWIFPPPLRLRY